MCSFGQSCLIQFEDFGNSNAFRLIEKYKDQYCTFNDDIQGTASVAVAGLLSATKLTDIKISENKFLFFGAGEASIGIATLCVMAMMKEGLTDEQARARIFMVDSKGLITQQRHNLTAHKRRFAQKHADLKDLADIVKTVKPTALIGVCVTSIQCQCLFRRGHDRGCVHRRHSQGYGSVQQAAHHYGVE